LLSTGLLTFESRGPRRGWAVQSQRAGEGVVGNSLEILCQELLPIDLLSSSCGAPSRRRP
jgi:hypothetical protein